MAAELSPRSLASPGVDRCGALYLKAHSYGEFVFDQAFAQVAGQLGLEYYPKLLGMSPSPPPWATASSRRPGKTSKP